MQYIVKVTELEERNDETISEVLLEEFTTDNKEQCLKDLQEKYKLNTQIDYDRYDDKYTITKTFVAVYDSKEDEEDSNYSVYERLDNPIDTLIGDLENLVRYFNLSITDKETFTETFNAICDNELYLSDFSLEAKAYWFKEKLTYDEKNTDSITFISNDLVVYTREQIDYTDFGDYIKAYPLTENRLEELNMDSAQLFYHGYKNWNGVCKLNPTDEELFDILIHNAPKDYTEEEFDEMVEIYETEQGEAVKNVELIADYLSSEENRTKSLEKKIFNLCHIKTPEYKAADVMDLSTLGIFLDAIESLARYNTYDLEFTLCEDNIIASGEEADENGKFCPETEQWISDMLDDYATAKQIIEHVYDELEAYIHIASNGKEYLYNSVRDLILRDAY